MNFPSYFFLLPQSLMLFCSYALVFLPLFAATFLFSLRSQRSPRLNKLRTMNYESCATLSYPAQFNIMLKYKNVEFLQLFAQKVRAFAHFCQLSVILLHVFAPFVSCPFYPNLPCCHSTSIYRPKTNIHTRRTKKNCNFPPNFKI